MTLALIQLIAAAVIDVVWGEPPNRYHPVVVMGHWATLKAGCSRARILARTRARPGKDPGEAAAPMTSAQRTAFPGGPRRRRCGCPLCVAGGVGRHLAPGGRAAPLSFC